MRTQYVIIDEEAMNLHFTDMIDFRSNYGLKLYSFGLDNALNDILPSEYSKRKFNIL